jgi:hypothetical protein
MNDSYDMDNGYGRWWKSTPTPCTWCNGKGHGDAKFIADKMCEQLSAVVLATAARLKSKRAELRKYQRIAKSASDK